MLARRNVFVLGVLLICSAIVLYDVFIAECATLGRLNSLRPNIEVDRQSEFKVISGVKSSSPLLPIQEIGISDQQTNKQVEALVDAKKKLAKKKARLTSTASHFYGSTSASVATSTTRMVVSVNQWSKSWPQVNIVDCSHIEYMNRGRNAKYREKAKEFPRTGIISFPGSGNTWTRHLIQQATGLWTGSVYKDESLYEGGFRAELDDCYDGGSVAIKAHYPRFEARSPCKFERAIIVLRDPYRAVLSEFNWRSTGKHTGVVDMRIYNTNSWKEHVIKRTEKWMSTTKTWIELFHKKTDPIGSNEQNPFRRSPSSSKTLLMVSYERMKENCTREMKRIVTFLGLKTFRSNCVQVDHEGNFRRKSSRSESIDCLFEKFNLKSEVEKRIHRLADSMIEIGLGDVTTEFEGPGGNATSEKCKYVVD